MRNAIIVSMLCSVLVGCGVEEVSAHAVWLSTPDGGDGCPAVCDPAGGFTADGCCAAGDPTPPAPLVSLQIEAAEGHVSAGSVNGPVFDGNSWTFGASLIPVRYPFHVQTGDTIVGFRVFVDKHTPNPVSAFLEQHVGLRGYHEGLGDQVSTSYPSGIVTLAAGGLSIPVQAGTSYSLRVYGNWQPGDRAMNAEVDIRR
jgi:hypothetical protein